jgi:hypothetical protein
MKQKNTKAARKFDCPRCDGTGDYEITTDDGNGCSESCRACGATGKVTPQDWQDWCDVAYGGVNRCTFPAEDFDGQ